MVNKQNILTYLLTLLFLCTFAIKLYGQDDYKKWLKEENEKFNKFAQEEDKQFVEFLKKEWIQIVLEKEMPVYKKPKPLTIPEYKPSINKKTINNPEIKKEDVKSKINNEPTGIIEKPPVNKDIPGTNETENPPVEQPPDIAEQLGIDLFSNNLTSDIDYFGSGITYYYNNSLHVGITGELDKNTVINYWKRMSSSDYKTCLTQAKYYKDKMELNDWGYAKLLYDYAKTVNNSSDAESYMFTWFMLTKSGYIVRIGYMGNNVALLIATNNRMFGQPYFYLKGYDQRFYSVSLDPDKKPLGGSIHIYKEDYPGANKIFSLNVKDIPEIKSRINSKVIKVKIGGEDYSFPVKYNTGVIKYFDYYPQTDFTVYFSAPMSKEASESILGDLKPLIKDKNEYDAVSFLLHFVQYATGYKTDDEQFKREKPLFPEESLYYDYSDCEDRAVLLAYLIKNLLNLEMVAIDYPDHMSLAVHFNSNVRGDYFENNGKKYVVTDPTYIGAGVGYIMPQYKNEGADLIEL